MHVTVTRCSITDEKTVDSIQVKVRQTFLQNTKQTTDKRE